MKWPILICLAFIIMGSGLNAEPSELERERNRRIANQLLFFFDSDKVVFNNKKTKKDKEDSKQTMFEALKENSSSSSWRVFSRILKKREMKENRLGYIKKSKAKADSDLIVFSSNEVRRAALEEILSLGSDGLDVLLLSIYSSRDHIRQGVLKTLMEFNDERILRVYDEVIFKDSKIKKKFSTTSKRYVALGVYKYLGSDHGKKIFNRCLQNKEPLVRIATLKTLKHIDKQYMPWVEKELLALYHFEWSLVLHQVNRFKEREDDVFLKGGQEKKSRTMHRIIDDKPQTLLYLAHALGAILLHAPQLVEELDLNKEMINHQMVGRLLVQNSPRLERPIAKRCF